VQGVPGAVQGAVQGALQDAVKGLCGGCRVLQGAVRVLWRVLQGAVEEVCALAASEGSGEAGFFFRVCVNI
jgi:hypothetical protein